MKLAPLRPIAHELTIRKYRDASKYSTRTSFIRTLFLIMPIIEQTKLREDNKIMKYPTIPICLEYASLSYEGIYPIHNPKLIVSATTTLTNQKNLSENTFFIVSFFFSILPLINYCLFA